MSKSIKKTTKTKKQRKTKRILVNKLPENFKIDNLEVEQSFRAQLPTASNKPDSWYVKFKDSSERALIKGPTTEEKVMDQLLIDDIKPCFGMERVDMKFVGDYLVCKDWGHGNYKVMEHKGVQIVDKKKTGAPMLRQWLEANKSTRHKCYPSLINILLFRYIFGVTDTHYNNILYIEAKDICLSVDEETILDWKRLTKNYPDCLFSKVPKKELFDELKKFIFDNKDKIDNKLIKWIKLLKGISCGNSEDINNALKKVIEQNKNFIF